MRAGLPDRADALDQGYPGLTRGAMGGGASGTMGTVPATAQPGNLTPGTSPSFNMGGMFSPEIAASLYNEPSDILSEMFKSSGIDATHNPFAQQAIARLGPVMQALIDFQQLIGGGGMDRTNTGAAISALQQGLGSGTTDPLALLQQVLGMAGGNEDAMGVLNLLGPEGILAMQARLSNNTPRVAQARMRTRQNQLAELRSQQRQRAGRGEDVSPTEWIRILQGGR